MTEQTPSKSKRRFAREPKVAEGVRAAMKPATHAKTSELPKAQTKISKVVALLGRDEGAALGSLVETTGWLPHTTRASLTGLRKKGYTIERSNHDGMSVYRITARPA